MLLEGTMDLIIIIKFVFVGIKVQLVEGGIRVLLGENAGGRAVMFWPIRFQCVAAYISTGLLCIYMYNWPYVCVCVCVCVCLYTYIYVYIHTHILNSELCKIWLALHLLKCNYCIHWGVSVYAIPQIYPIFIAVLLGFRHLWFIICLHTHSNNWCFTLEDPHLLGAGVFKIQKCFSAFQNHSSTATLYYFFTHSYFTSNVKYFLW